MKAIAEQKKKLKSQHGEQEMFLHPNLDNSNPMTPIPQKRPSSKKGKCIAWFKEFDANKLKPLLLYNYDKESHKLRKEFYN